MCKCLPRENLRVLGILFTFLIAVLTFPCLLLSGIDFNETNMEWTLIEPWYRIGALKVGCAITLILPVVIGFMTFTCLSESKFTQKVFLYVNALSTILTFATSIMVLMGSSLTVSKNCLEKTNGIFQFFNSLDKYFQEADQNLCNSTDLNGTECRCRFTNSTALDDFQQNLIFYNEYKHYNFTEDKKLGAIQIQNCPGFVNEVIKQVNKDPLFVNNIGTQDEASFAKFAAYWGRIEEKFKCTGWCSLSYQDHKDKERHLYKYLFSDINFGPVKQRCMEPVMNWIKQTLEAYGSVTMIIFIFQSILWLIDYSILKEYTKDSKRYKPKEKHYKKKHKKPKEKEEEEEEEDEDSKVIELI